MRILPLLLLCLVTACGRLKISSDQEEFSELSAPLCQNIANIGETYPLRSSFLAEPKLDAISLNAQYGEDVWSDTDSFAFCATRINDSFELIAQIHSLESTQDWAKAGLMFRSDETSSSPNVFIAKNRAGHWLFQRRIVKSGHTLQFIDEEGTQDSWVKLKRYGSDICGYRSAEGKAWTLVGCSKIEPSTYPQPRVGLALSTRKPLEPVHVLTKNIRLDLSSSLVRTPPQLINLKAVTVVVGNAGFRSRFAEKKWAAPHFDDVSHNSETNLTWRGVTFGKKLFVATGGGTPISGTSYGARTMWSTNGIDWSVTNQNLNHWIGSPTYGNGFFVAGGACGLIARASDPQSFEFKHQEITADPSGCTPLRMAEYSNGIFYIKGDSRPGLGAWNLASDDYGQTFQEEPGVPLYVFSRQVADPRSANVQEAYRDKWIQISNRSLLLSSDGKTYASKAIVQTIPHGYFTQFETLFLSVTRAFQHSENGTNFFADMLFELSEANQYASGVLDSQPH